jgi:ABC-type multidrug transport system ATPase subunit
MNASQGRHEQELHADRGVFVSVTLNDAGKRYNREWIFRHLDAEFFAGRSYAITGPNGSGKSTLLQAIAGSMEINEGSIQFRFAGREEPAAAENIFQSLAIVAPYLELIEEMTAKEFLHFHSSFKPMLAGLTAEEMVAKVGIENALNKQIRYYSSGMKQRLKLAQAIFADVPVLLLDEPCTNLDSAGYDLYHTLIENYCAEKLVIVSSNDSQEMDFCKERISIMDFKR